jgi:hypothetical protein
MGGFYSPYGEMGQGMGGVGEPVANASARSSSRPGAAPASVRPQDKSRMIDQIMMQRKMQGQAGQAMSNDQMLRLGGPEYMNYIDELRMNPNNAWF